MAASESFRDVVIFIEGMTCQSCVRNIEGTISKRDGIKLITVSLDKKLAYVKYDPSRTSPTDVSGAIDDMGFETSLGDVATTSGEELEKPGKNSTAASLTISVEGMTCQSCVRHIEGTLSDRPGVSSIRVSLENKNAVITYDPRTITPVGLRDAIDDMGFEAALPDNFTESSEADRFSFSLSRILDASCAENLRATVVGKVAGVKNVSIVGSEVKVEFESGLANADAILAEVRRLGLSESASGLNAVGLLLANCPSTGNSQAPVECCVVSVKGMTCNSCVKNIEGTMSGVTGVVSISVSLERERADVKFDPSLISAMEIVDRIDDMGFEASLATEEATSGWKPLSEKPHSNSTVKSHPNGGHSSNGRIPIGGGAHSNGGGAREFDPLTLDGEGGENTARCFISVSGMTCGSCVSHIERHLKKYPGVQSVLVSLMAQKADIRYDPDLQTAAALAAYISDIGFTASVMDDRASTGQSSIDVTVSAAEL